jgi:signal peptidase I
MRRTKDTIVSFEPIGKEDEVRVRKIWKVIYEWSDSLVFAIIAVFLVFAFIFRIASVEGASMNPTLKDGDWLAVKSISTEIKRGDIVIITQPNALNEPLVKRVIAVGGDTIDINFTEGIVKINGEVIHEPFIAEPTQRQFDIAFPITVPQGYYFVMGDNRNNSIDSRSNIVGFISYGYILGTAEARLYPLGDFRVE